MLANFGSRFKSWGEMALKEGKSPARTKATGQEVGKRIVHQKWSRKRGTIRGGKKKRVKGKKVYQRRQERGTASM